MERRLRVNDRGFLYSLTVFKPGQEMLSDSTKERSPTSLHTTIQKNFYSQNAAFLFCLSIQILKASVWCLGSRKQMKKERCEKLN